MPTVVKINTNNKNIKESKKSAKLAKETAEAIKNQASKNKDLKDDIDSEKLAKETAEAIKTQAKLSYKEEFTKILDNLLPDSNNEWIDSVLTDEDMKKIIDASKEEDETKLNNVFFEILFNSDAKQYIRELIIHLDPSIGRADLDIIMSRININEIKRIWNKTTSQSELNYTLSKIIEKIKNEIAECVTKPVQVKKVYEDLLKKVDKDSDIAKALRILKNISEEEPYVVNFNHPKIIKLMKLENMTISSLLSLIQDTDVYIDLFRTIMEEARIK